MALPPIREIAYNKEKLGYFGELGSGAHARIRFLQSAVSKEELDNITLIEQIPGSERWDIRDLFQRDVDMVRVEGAILPYLKDADKVKFFNPLTLVLLPISNEGVVNPDVPFVEPIPLEKEGHKYTKYERSGLLSFEVHNDIHAYSRVQWHDAKVRLVAIDGQHRLSALKFWKNAGGPSDLDNWQIPVVILGIFKADDDSNHKPDNLLEIVRRTFVYINQKAEKVNEARLILLNDEAVADVCTQDLVQESHKNDCLSDSDINKARLPLFFFDWRGQVNWQEDMESSTDVSAPGAILSIVEIRDWIKHYVLSDRVNAILGVDELEPPLSDRYRAENLLTNEDARRVRAQFMNLIYPGFSHLLEQFDPFRKYVEKVRSLESTRTSQSEAATYAFARLRFGTEPPITRQMKAVVDTEYQSIVGQLGHLRDDCFDQIIHRDIGKRALIYSFATLKISLDNFADGTSTWLDHATWFVPKVNAVYQNGWFKSRDQLKAEQAKILTHITIDPSANIVNYRINDVPKAFGLLLALLVAREGLSEFTDEQRAELWDQYGGALDAALRKGFRKEHRTRERDIFKGTNAEFIDHVNKLAGEDVSKRLTFIRTKLLPSSV